MEANYVLRNRQALKDRNYIRKAAPSNDYWVDFTEGPLDKYVEKWGDQFNVVIAGDETIEGDFYVLPYTAVKHLLVAETLTHDKLDRKRWSGYVVRNRLTITNSHSPLDIGEYYGRPFLLTHFDLTDNASDEEENDYAIENRKAEIQQRVKQSVFRQRVLANFEGRCCIAGFTEPELLIASHIVPWAKRVDSRLDPANGLCLSIFYDQLFDEGFITFDDELRIIVTPHTSALSDRLQQELKAIEGKLACRPMKTAIKPEYLAYHRENVFRGGAIVPREMPIPKGASLQ